MRIALPELRFSRLPAKNPDPEGFLRPSRPWNVGVPWDIRVPRDIRVLRDVSDVPQKARRRCLEDARKLGRN